jgi:hypothetical protein
MSVENFSTQNRYKKMSKLSSELSRTPPTSLSELQAEVFINRNIGPGLGASRPEVQVPRRHYS